MTKQAALMRYAKAERNLKLAAAAYHDAVREADEAKYELSRATEDIEND